MSKKSEIVIKEVGDLRSVDSFIEQGIKANATVETMEKLFSLREKVKASHAKEEFVKAMSKFQADCPTIKKNKDVREKPEKGGKLRYSYASLDSIVSQVKKNLQECGLSYSTNVTNQQGFVTATCTITHVLGHREESSFQIPIDESAYMSAPQKYASALTFAKRYAFCNALGILTGEDDIDATDQSKGSELAGVTSIKGKITFLLKELGVDVNKVDIKKEIKRKTGLDVSDNLETLEEIKGRLEVLVQESKA